MSYHGHKNVEQSLQQVEGHVQAQRAVYGSSSEAMSDEVFSELSKGQAHMLKKGIAGSYAEEGFGIPSEGGGFKKFGNPIAGGEELAKMGYEGQELKHFGKREMAKLAQLGEADGEGFANEVLGKKGALKSSLAGGESFGQKALEQNVNTSDNFANGLMMGVGTVLGPIGLPLVITAQARMLRDQLSQSKSAGEYGSSGFHNEMTQRQKMLKSWKLDDR